MSTALFCLVLISVSHSDVGLGAMLAQGEAEDEQVICYNFRTLIKAERNYSVTERGCLAVLFGIDNFRPYIKDTTFLVLADHYFLLWLISMKDMKGWLGHWSVKLAQYIR